MVSQKSAQPRLVLISDPVTIILSDGAENCSCCTLNYSENANTRVQGQRRPQRINNCVCGRINHQIQMIYNGQTCVRRRKWCLLCPWTVCVCVCVLLTQLASEVAGFGFSSTPQCVNVKLSRSSEDEKSGVITIFVVCVLVCVLVCVRALILYSDSIKYITAELSSL